MAKSLLIGLVAVCASCRSDKAGPKPPPPPVVTAIRPGSAEVQGYYEYNGYLDAVEVVEIRARVKGYLDDVLFKEGDEVKAGAQLYVIDPREYRAAVAKSKADIAKAAADQANAAAQVQLAEAELGRLRAAGGTSVSMSELDKAVATLAANKAQVDVAVASKAAAEAALRTAELQLGYTDIKAPIAGRISRTLVTRGNLVGQTESTLLTTIVSVDPMYVYFDAPERDLIEYQRALKDRTATAGPAGSIPVQVGVTTEEGYPHAGKIDFRDNRVDTGSGTVRIRGQIPNPLVPPGNARLLYPGLFARVRVPNGPARQRAIIPEDALMTGQEGRYVYVVGPENKVLKRSVTVGTQVWRAAATPPGGKPDPSAWTLTIANPPADGKPAAPPAVVRSAVAIDSGLTADDVVIVNGLQKARPGAPVTPEEWKLQGPAAK